MRLDALSRLVRLSLARERKGAFFSAFGVAMGVGALVFFVGLGLGVGHVIREKVFPTDARLVDVVPPAVSLGSLLGGGKLDAPTVERLRELPGVEAAYRKMNVRVPAVTRYDGVFFGTRLRMGMEVLALGVEPALVQGDVQMGEFKDAGEGQPIPALVSTRLLELYNKTFAPARKLPQLSANMLVGFGFPVEFNRSYVAAASASGPTQPGQAQVVGASDRALLAGITIPLDAAIRLNRAFGVDAENYSGVTLVATDPSQVPVIVDAVKGMGLEIDDQERRMAENSGAAVALTTSALALLSLLICILAAVNIAHALSASVRARAKEIGVMQAVGASRADIRAIVLAEAAVVGLAGGAAGTIAALLMALGVNRLAAGYLPNFPFKPDSFFSFPWPVVVGGVVLGLVAALAGAYFPSRRAAATDPARTLAG
ncbi:MULTISPECIES: FtsX-like permease family protein [Myxococcus]|uniref:FtsX-like permease family protein n=1 Tax=Myxococcus TaxID=32 RepID=UPI00112C55B5|nr:MULTISPECIES: ABC transporter permease [Myxococcus]QDE85256.1 cell division protein FtsX [Myxococcus xanthus]QDE99418.1 cell division protein FtsX [Myxococcus xanthus]QDF07127.1 cell division protein FtsX [Myxococcus xanthus]WAM24738.1 ABC transporter permease [Myxococcus sp. NMCA1]